MKHLRYKDLRKDAEERLQEKKRGMSDRESSLLPPDKIQHIIHELNVHQVELEMQNEELRQAQDELNFTLERYKQLFNFSPIGYCIINNKGIVDESNYTISHFLGRERHKIINFSLSHFVHPDDTIVLLNNLNSQREHLDFNCRMITASGKIQNFWIQINRLDQEQRLVALSNTTKMARLTDELKLKSMVVDNALEGVLITDSKSKICYVNRAFETITGYKSKDIVGLSPNLLKSGKQSDSFYKKMWTDLKNNGSWQGEIWNKNASGEIYPEWLSLTTIEDEWGVPVYYAGMFTDISTQSKIRKRLHQLAYYDVLTHLPNRVLLNDRIKQLYADSQRNSLSFAVLYMDLDRFKNINDNLGHTVGDQLLVEVSQRIKSLLREIDTIARMGGDEFMILLPQLKAPEDATTVAKKILKTMARPFDLEGGKYHISLSIGISFYPESGSDTETLIKHADIAMYQSKINGRNTYAHFKQDYDKAIMKKFNLELDLRNALKLNQLELYYQPQFDLETMKISGVEALLRWNHPTKKMIPPLDFISVAEDTGQIIDIGYWVIQEACEQYMRWKEQGIDVGNISVNLSPHQFLQSDLVDQITAILDNIQMPKNKFGIELTETAAMPNYEYSIKTLKAFQQQGIFINIDDFGTGFSSLSYLRYLPIDGLKIDRSFVDEIPENKDDMSITKTIIAMAHNLNLNIIAEGVETQQQLKFLQQQGAQNGQGFLVSKPLPADQLADFYRQAQ